MGGQFEIKICLRGGLCKLKKCDFGCARKLKIWDHGGSETIILPPYILNGIALNV